MCMKNRKFEWKILTGKKNVAIKFLKKKKKKISKTNVWNFQLLFWVTYKCTNKRTRRHSTGHSLNQNDVKAVYISCLNSICTCCSKVFHSEKVFCTCNRNQNRVLQIICKILFLYTYIFLIYPRIALMDFIATLVQDLVVSVQLVSTVLMGLLTWPHL